MKYLKKLVLTGILAFTSFMISGQTICGYVLDSQSGERLSGVNFRNLETGVGSVSDNNGFYCIGTSDNSNWLVSYIGYKTDTIVITTKLNPQFNIHLLPVAIELSQVEVVQTATETNFLKGMTKITATDLNIATAFLGEKDLVKVIATKAGVNAGSEGFSTFSVRGGGTDHNLFILDGAPIYNSGHLFNIVSVFNSEAVKDISLYKGYYPPRYGGRLASVIEVNFRDGNSKEIEAKADLGIINSKLSLEGPIGKKGKSSFMFAARSTYLDLLKHNKLKRIEKTPLGSFNSESDFGYTFADINLKFNHIFNDKNRMFVSLYSGVDHYRIRDVWFSSRRKFTMNRRNNLISVKSLHNLSNKLFLELITSATSYSNSLSDHKMDYWHETFFDHNTFIQTNVFHLQSIVQNKSFNSITDILSEGHVTYKISNKSLLKGGISLLHHKYLPADYFTSVVDTSGNALETILKGNKPTSIEPASYLSLETDLSNRLSLLAGLRVSGFISDNAGYLRPEPRLSLGYNAGNAGSFTIAFAVMQQYNHALMRNEQLMQNIVWVPSTNLIKPEKSMEYSLNHLRLFNKAQFKLETSIYYKQMSSLVFFNGSHSDFQAFYNWEDKTTYGGIGRGHGLEVTLEKLKGRFTGATSYSYSRHERKFSAINKNRWFPYKYNREHEFNFSGNMKVSANWTISAFWTISSGMRINIPNGYVNENPFGYGYFTYSSLNNHKLPDYHRLDLSAEWSKMLKNKKRIGVSFNIYNAYNRQNSNYVYYDSEPIFNSDGEFTGSRQMAKSVSLIPFLPSVNISYKFK